MPPPQTRASLRKAGVKEIAVLGNKCIPSTKRRSVFSDLTNAKKSNTKETMGKKADKLKKEEKEVLHKLDSVAESQTDFSSLDTNTSNSDAYSTAEENSLTSLELSETKDDSHMSFEEAKTPEPIPNVSPKRDLPEGVRDYDLDNWRDSSAASCYAMDIFNYLKEREEKFAVKKYMDHQPLISSHMRAVLVDWLVEVQESFELNHEALYLAVKIVDLFLDRTKQLRRELLQLVGVTSIFIACKFDERCPPAIDDFLYICDDAYNRKQMIAMEKKILKTIDFDLGAPLSYSFQRRYARCASLTMSTLTLARYILETSLMEYDFVVLSDSKIAAASLCLALRMEKHEWSKLLQYYSGYIEDDLNSLVRQLNEVMHASKHSEMKVIRNKYSHDAFFNVANIPLPPIDN